MTSNCRLFVNNTFTKFNECCQSYPTLTQVCSQAEHLKVLISEMDLATKSPSLAGRLSHYTHNWEHVMQDQWVLQAMSGYPLELTQAPHQMRQAQAIKCSAEERIKEVSDLLTKGAIVESQESTGGYVSPNLPCGEERGGGQRPVINLKGFNSFIRVEHFKMEGLHLRPDLIQSQDWMVKLDLKGAYLPVPIHQEHQCLLQFQWEQKTYQFVCLPFGLTSAPRVSTKITKPVVGALRQMRIHLIIYLDDILIMHQEREHLMQLTSLLCQMFEALGLIVNIDKSQLTPSQKIEFLGFLVNSVPLHLAFPSEN